MSFTMRFALNMGGVLFVMIDAYALIHDAPDAVILLNIMIAAGLFTAAQRG